MQNCDNPTAVPDDVPPLPARSIRRTPFESRRRVLTVVFGIFISVLLLSLESQWPPDGVVRELLFFVGICLAAVGTLGRTWCHLFISGYKTKSLIMTGPYSVCRNPLYFFSAVGLIGIGLCSGTFTIPVVMILFFGVYYPWIIHSEEVRLSANHAHEFKDYCRMTPAFWPKLRTFREPETYVTFPRIMRRNISDGFWFIVLAAAVHVVSELQESNILPSLFEVW